MPRAKHARVALVWSPSWSGLVEKQTRQFIKNNQWRCDKVFEFDDLLQEAYCIFLYISEKYPRIITETDFMRVYQRALSNWFHDRAAYMKRKNSRHVDLRIDPTEILSLASAPDHTGYIKMLLDEAPSELKLALALVAEHPECLEGRSNGLRENLNMRLRRILGLSEKFDLKLVLTDLLFN